MKCAGWRMCCGSLSTHGETMSPIGWIIMLASVLGMTTLFFWCIYKVITHSDAEEQVHSPADIDPHDQGE
mgnify:CR=1 FL=1